MEVVNVGSVIVLGAIFFVISHKKLWITITLSEYSLTFFSGWNLLDLFFLFGHEKKNSFELFLGNKLYRK